MENNQEKGKLPPIRTLKTDTSGYIKDKDISIVDMIAAEEKKYAGREENGNLYPKKFPFWIVGIIAVVVIGGIFGASFLLKKKEPVRPEAIIPPSLVFSEIQDKIILKTDEKRELTSEISKKLKADYQRGVFAYVPIMREGADIDEILEVQRFFGILGIKDQENLLSSLDGAFTFGIFTLDQKWPVIIFSVRSYERAFAGMLKWESKMIQDLNFFPLDMGGGGMIPGISFEDKALQNHDIRVLKNAENGEVLVYSFPDRSALIITTSLEPMKEMFRRMAIPK